MKIGSVDLEKEVLVIAEIGNNHEGSYALAEEMIGLAKQSGAQAVKFQTFRTEFFISNKDKDRFARLKSFELSFQQFEKLAAFATQQDLIFISTPFDIESAKFLAGIVVAFKIASSDNTFYPLLDEVARRGKPVILSSGLADMDQIAFSAAYIQEAWRRRGIIQELSALHCVTSYPVAPNEANLGAIATMREQIRGVTIGYSDHTLGIEAAVMSVALGARIVEKHFTKNKNQSSFRDHQISADPQDMADLVRRIKEVSVLLGTGRKVLQPSEKQNEVAVRRSIVAARNLTKGSILSMHDITWTRPSGGLPPGSENQILGRIINQDINFGDAISLEMFKAENP
jgi:N,N'-diacetyllegionaminate synthase